jgi:ubiquinone/menaquinone biosynthesis C-methylase UbiE
MNLDMTKLEPLLGKVINEVGAAQNAALVIVGDKLGLFRALAEGPMTPAELAKKTGTYERYVRDWLSAQAASGFATYDVSVKKFSLSPEQAAVFGIEDSPHNMSGAFMGLASAYEDHTKLADAFTTGEGLGWGSRCNCLFCGTERLFAPGYRANLIAEWLPVLDGVVPKLKKGGKVADVGCGHGVSTIVMAEAYPKSEFIGFDFHEGSIKHARGYINGHKNVRFETSGAQNFNEHDYDLVTMFDALHDMGDPVGVAAHVRKKLKRDGTFMVVEPMARDKLEDNFNPVGRLFYAASTNFCVPASLNQDIGTALGAQAGEKRLSEVLSKAGFRRIRLAHSTPFNLVLEARP